MSAPVSIRFSVPMGATLLLLSAGAEAITYGVAQQDGAWGFGATWTPTGIPQSGEVCLLDPGDQIETSPSALEARLVLKEGSVLRVDNDTTADDIQMEGGKIIIRTNVATYQLDGSINVTEPSRFSVGRNRQRALRLAAHISGDATIILEDFDPADESATGILEVSAANNPFSGNWIVENGILEANADGCLGTGSIAVRAGKRAELKIDSGAAITESNSLFLEGSGAGAGKVRLDVGVRVGALTIDGIALNTGVYDSSTHPDHIVGMGSMTIDSATRAFPTAEGSGASALGGRGGAVYKVTNLNDSGPGSLREAIQENGARTVLFEVSGTIALQSDLVIQNSFITIAGQTAPGDGICLKDRQLIVEADHVIIRYLRSRIGDSANEDVDAIWIRDSDHVMLDHCSASWGVDENLSITRNCDHLTVQWCIISEGLYDSVHSEGKHGFGSLIRGQEGAHYSFHHNLWAHNASRSPRPGGNMDIADDPVGLVCDFRNNVMYNWGQEFAGTNLDGNVLTKYNFINNYYQSGPDTDADIVIIPEIPFVELRYYAFNEQCPVAKAHFSGNRMDGDRPDDPYDLVDGETGGSYKSATPFDTPGGLVATSPAQDAFNAVLASVGASFPRDRVDNRVITDVINGTGSIIDDESEVGGWPVLDSEAAPADTDCDGMPDSWEIARGFNPNDAADGQQDSTSNGYSNLEEYINNLVDNVSFEITGSAGPGGSITLPPAGLARANATIVVFINPDPYFSVSSVQVDGSTVPVTTALEFATVTADHTITATFDPDLTVNNPTPLWWLAENGLLDFEDYVLADTDGDGLANWQEFRLVTNPLDKNSALPSTSGTTMIGNDEFLTITYRRPAGSSEVVDTVEVSNEVETWQSGAGETTVVGSPVDNGDGTESVTVRGNDPITVPGRQFMRVKFLFP